MTRCGNTQPHTKSLSLKQDRGRPPGCATFACAYKARTPDGQAACIQATLYCAVRRGQGDAGRHSGCQLRRCKRRQGAYRQEAGGRDCRSKRFGARAARRVLPRGDEGGVHTAWRAGSGPAEAARQAGMWGREGGEGFASSLPRLPAPASKGLDGIFHRMQIVKGLPLSGNAFLFANRKSTANRKKRSLFVGYIASGT